jgi:hypothetical protein
LDGFDNLYYTVKKELKINDEDEFAVTVGMKGQVLLVGLDRLPDRQIQG